MKSRCYLLLAMLGTMIFATTPHAEEIRMLKTERDQVNYAIGVYLINNIKQQGIEVDLDLLLQGMRDA